MRGPTARQWRASAMSPSRTVMSPSCIFFDPATSAISVDLPTPSGPTMPTMMPLGMSSEMSSSATTLMGATGRSVPTGGAPASAGDAIDRSPHSLGQRPDGGARVDEVLQLGRPDRRVLGLHVADAADTGLDPLDVVPDHLFGQLD